MWDNFRVQNYKFLEKQDHALYNTIEFIQNQILSNDWLIVRGRLSSVGPGSHRIVLERLVELLGGIIETFL